MNLSFDSIADLDEFLRWADLYRAPGTREPDAPTARERKLFALDTTTGAGTSIVTILGTGGGGGAGGGTLFGAGDGGDVAFDTPPGVVALPSDTGSDPVTEQATANVAEPAPRRKRRTKAEIEADNKTAGAGHVDVARVAHEDGSVTTTSIGLPPDVNPSEVTPAPTGTNPFEQPAATAAADTPAADDGDTVVTPFQHLTRAREFIAKHGMPKYNETFTKAALDANVMGYSAYQRALHMSAMDELDKA